MNKNKNKNELAKNKKFRDYSKTPLHKICKISPQIFEEFMFDELLINPMQPKPVIIQKMMDEFGIAVKTAYHWYNLALEHFANMNDNSIEIRYLDAMQNLQKLYDEAIMENDKHLALNVQRELNKINGLYVQKFDINVTTTPPIFNIDDGDIINIDDINIDDINNNEDSNV